MPLKQAEASETAHESHINGGFRSHVGLLSQQTAHKDCQLKHPPQDQTPV